MLGNIKHHINISMSWINDHYYYIKLTIVVFIERFTLEKNMKYENLSLIWLFFKQSLCANPVLAS